jgi:hypothetical protein
MTDLWEDEGFGSAGGSPDADGEDDWDDGDESLESALEDGLGDPSELDDEDWDDDEGEG